MQSIVLSSVKGALPGDYITPQTYLDGTNFITTPNFQTLFYVSAADAPTITITSSSNIVGSSSGGCFISGTTKS